MRIIKKLIKYGIVGTVGAGIGFSAASVVAGKEIERLRCVNRQKSKALEAAKVRRQVLLAPYIAKRIDDFQKQRKLDQKDLVKILKIQPAKLSAYRKQLEFPSDTDLQKLDHVLKLGI